MMGLCGTCWTGILILLPACVTVHSVIFHGFHGICKSCERSSPVCEDAVCHSNCGISSICSGSDDICAAIWKETNNTVTVQTMCHNRTLPLEGVDPGLLLNFDPAACHMIPQTTEEGAVMVCGCDGDECNDELYFYKDKQGDGLRGQDLILVVVISLSPVLVTIVTAVTLYFYHKRRSTPASGPERWSQRLWDRGSDGLLAPGP